MGVETMMAGATIGGALISSSAVGDTADAQAAGTAAATAENRRQFDQTRADYAPYRAIGTNALRRIAALYGINDGASAAPSAASGSGLSEAQVRAMLTPQYTTAATPASVTSQGDADFYNAATPASVRQSELDAAVREFMGGGSAVAPTAPQTYNDGLDGPIQMDPGYEFGLQQGNQALDRKVSAAGGRVSGAAIRQAMRYGTDYATTGYNSAYQRRQDSINRLQTLAGIGQTSTNASAQAGQNMANANAGLYSAQGNAAGAASLAQGNIWGNATNQLGAIGQRWARQPSSGFGWGASGGYDTMGFGGEY